MKKYFILITLFVCSIVAAQNITDVLRYSADNTQGTARYQAMSGAFGALGGDLSSLNVNPAGSAVFNNSLISFSGSNYNVKNSAAGSPEVNRNNIELNQVGGVFVFKSTDQNSHWKKISVAINYDRIQNFDNQVSAAYTTQTGIDQYFLNFAQGQPLGQLLLQDGEFIEEAYLDIGASLGFREQQAFLGIFGGIIDAVDPNDDNNTDYVSLTNYANGVNQTYRKSSFGYNDKFTANFATQYKENLYLGASLNFHSIFSEQLTLITESGYDADSPVRSASFDNLLRTQGSGFSFSLGAIGKLNDFIRVGASYQSPTWNRLNDEFSQRINSNLADIDINFIDFDEINLYERYTIKTPEKLTGSLALVFAKTGLLSVDYSYQDMSKAELRPVSDPNFASENEFIRNQLQAVSSIRLGGEYKIERFSLRGGYRYEQSPYANNVIGDLKGVSGGVGYDFGPSRLDFALNSNNQDIRTNTLSTGPSPTLDIATRNTNATLTYTINF
ncbi:MAG: outer membrane protein transport protein [Cellulophaga sp.]|nr:outer membrane protein transport protein [Cellulophaga sp.]